MCHPGFNEVHAHFRPAFRRLSSQRGFTFAALTTLALCIGANVAIFAVVDCVLLRPLPFPAPDRLVIAYNSYPKAGVERSGASIPNYYERRTAVPAFGKTAGIRSGSVIVGETGAPQRVEVERVTPEFFETVGVSLARGRSFTDEETEYARSAVVILTDAYWAAHFHRDPEVLGKTLRVDGLPVTVVGLLPPNFRYLSSKAQLYFPLASGKEERGVDRRHSNNLQLIARLAPGATIGQAQSQIDALNTQLLANDPYGAMVKDAGYHTVVASLREDHVREVRPILLFLQGGALSLLAIGAVNLMNLLLIRASARAKEFAVRQALGARRRDIVNDALAETLLLSVVGGALGLGLGFAGIRLLATLGIHQLPMGANVVLDGRVAIAAVLGSLALGVALATPILWFNLRARLAAALQADSRSGTVTRGAQRLRHGFIVTQVALAFVLLAGASLLGLSLKRVLAESPGFQPDHLLTGKLSLPWNNYRETPARLAFIERLLGELRAQPGVTFASVSSGVPLAGTHDDNAILVEGQPPTPGKPLQAHYTSGVLGDYWKVLGVPLHEGRFLEDADNHREEKVCVVDEDFAQRYWPGASALGRRIEAGAAWDEKRASTIVGVVGAVKQIDLSQAAHHGAVYFPYGQYGSQSFEVVLRSSVAPTSLAQIVRQVVLKIDPELPIDNLRSMEGAIDESLLSRRSPALLAAFFAAVALVLAALGTYGVLAYAVAQRRREIGLRMALGAVPEQISGLFLKLGARLLVGGLAIGVLGTWGVGQLMHTLLYGVTGLNPAVLSITAVVLVAVVVLASFLPSRRAARVPPAEALRLD